MSRRLPDRNPRGTYLDRGTPRDADPAECWPWKGNTCATGYGIVWDTKRRKQVYAHRLAWEMENDAAIPEGAHVLHSCDNPPCVNPAHLSLGTHQENMRQKAERGRAPSIAGESAPNSKLTATQVAEIRRMVAAGVSQRKTAAAFGVSQPTISYIVRGKAWKA